ncbi:zinc-ribbon domain-containing protein [Methanolapillus millepedarum]|uniref:Zinc-ribbon domain-containing protein n=1 Tax=Methanolapillus millepedarum TaxID=3028296 RepID=A0AA96VD80_9EURY|nr:hypothetical protein MsAc7_16880 [Methanosarcinaceae archaeon Ac7]
MSANYCPNCGNKIDESNAVICTNCGMPLKKTPYGNPPEPPKSDEPSAEKPPAVDAELVSEPKHSNDSNTNAGGSSSSSSSSASSSVPPKKSEKISFLSVILSFFWPGLGQLYNGQFWKGIAIYILTPIGLMFLIVPGIAIWIYGMYDAYTQSEKMNKGEIPYTEAKLWEILVFVLFPFIIAAIFIVLMSLFMVPFITGM